MLQSNGVHAPLGGVVQSDHAEESGIGDLINFSIGLLQRQYVVILVTAALVLAACLTYLRITPPTYTAKAQILLENPKAQFVQQQSLLADPAMDVSQIETQIQVLKSQAIASMVIGKLNLAEDPDFKETPSLLSSLSQRAREWFSLSRKTQHEPVDDQPQDQDDVIAAFEHRLTAERVSVSNVIEIGFSSSSASRAAEIANAVAKAYLSDQLNAKFDANRTATSWLQDRLRDLGEQALTADRAVSAYKSQNNIVSPGGKPIDDQQISEINSRLVAARAQTSDAKAKLDSYEAILSANPASSSSIGTLDAASADSINSPIISSLRQQYLELSRREREWSARFGHDHLAVINLRNRMRDLRTSIFEEVTRLAEASRNEYTAAKQRQQAIEKQLNEAVSQSHSTNSAELTIRELESRAKGLRTLYETFLQRYMGSVQQESFPISETRVISPAIPPQSKSKPKTPLILAFGIMGGIAAGIGLGLLRDTMDRVFRTSAQIESTLELPCLSLVPLIRNQSPPKQATLAQQTDEVLRHRTITTNSAILNAIVDTPLSRFTEAIRSIKLSVDLNPNKTSNDVIGITSALPSEGKTTIATALARLIAHSGKKVIVVDCDLRNPSLTANLAPNAAAGIIEVINGTRTLEEVVWRDPKTNLVLLPVVRRGPLFHTSEILAADTMRRLFERLRTTYDYIIVDLPPLAPLVDVRVTTPLVDCFILVVEWGRTKIDVVQHALHTAPNIYDCLVGTVLNKTDMRAMARYDNYSSDYYSDDHYAHYGFSDTA